MKFFLIDKFPNMNSTQTKIDVFPTQLTEQPKIHIDTMQYLLRQTLFKCDTKCALSLGNQKRMRYC